MVPSIPASGDMIDRLEIRELGRLARCWQLGAFRDGLA